MAMRCYPELMTILKDIACDNENKSVSAIADELEIPVAELIEESVPRVEFMIKNLTIFLTRLNKVKRRVH